MYQRWFQPTQFQFCSPLNALFQLFLRAALESFSLAFDSKQYLGREFGIFPYIFLPNVISYFYRNLKEPDAEYYSYAQEKDVTIIDLACEDTEQFFHQSTEKLSERERFALNNILAGKAPKEIGATLHLSNSRVQTLAGEASRKLRYLCYNRYLKTARATPSISCSIFAMDIANYKNLYSFEQIITFLMWKYHITQFYVSFEYCQSAYMNILENLTKSKTRITAITYGLGMTNEKKKQIAVQLCPPCRDIKNIDISFPDELQIAKIMINQADFCICNLSENPFAANIRQLICEAKDVTLFDIGKKDIEYKPISKNSHSHTQVPLKTENRPS